VFVGNIQKLSEPKWFADRMLPWPTLNKSKNALKLKYFLVCVEKTIRVNLMNRTSNQKIYSNGLGDKILFPRDNV
jgi:hypothetical protein